jgi:HEAT repeat protein
MGPRGRGAKPALTAAVKDDNHWVRCYAIEALGNMGAEAASAVGDLVPLLDHPEAFTRRRAAEALGRIGPPAKQAVAALTMAHDNDRDQFVRTAAGVALYQVNLQEIAAQSFRQASDELRHEIRKLQTGDEFAAVTAANALAEMGHKASGAVPALALSLRHKNKWIREAAAKALGSMGGPDPEPEVRAAAQKALDQLEPK